MLLELLTVVELVPVQSITQIERGVDGDKQLDIVLKACSSSVCELVRVRRDTLRYFNTCLVGSSDDIQEGVLWHWGGRNKSF